MEAFSGSRQIARIGSRELALLAVLRLTDRFLILTYLSGSEPPRGDAADCLEASNVDTVSRLLTTATLDGESLKWLGSGVGGSLSPGVAQHAFLAPRGRRAKLTFSCHINGVEADAVTWEVQVDAASRTIHMPE